MTIGISGASGLLGRATTDVLLERVEPGDLVLVTRDPAQLDAYAERGADVRRGDFDDPEGLRETYRGVDRLLLISGADVGRRVAQHTAAIASAKDAGVGRIAYTSIVNPTEANPAAAAPEHRGTEAALLASGLEWTMLRNGMYADLTAEALTQSVASGRHVYNSGDGKTAFVSRADCAAAAAAVLTGDGHANRAYDITGPDLLSGADLAALASELSGTPVEAVAVDDDTYVSILVEYAGLPETLAQFLASFGRASRESQLSTQSNAVEELTGNPPQRVRTEWKVDDDVRQSRRLLTSWCGSGGEPRRCRNDVRPAVRDSC
jgi:NAD(P)H dehydrogenase (quinone)